MPVSRLAHIPGIGVDEIGDAADATGNPDFLRLENLDTDVPPPAIAREITHAAVEDDDANSYLPFQGHRALREAAAEHVGAITGSRYDPGTQCVSVAGGLNGILNVLLATVEPGQEVVICDPIYAGLVNRIRLAGGIPRYVRCVPGERGWATDPGEMAAAIGPQTAAVLLMSPAMPTGAVLSGEHFDAIADPVNRHGAWVIWDAAMERLVFGNNRPVHPGAQHGPFRCRSVATPLYPCRDRGDADDRLGAQRRALPPPGVRQRANRTARRPTDPLRCRACVSRG